MVNAKRYKEEGWKCGKCGFKYGEDGKDVADGCCIRKKPLPYEKCPKCKKKGLHQLAVNDHNILMRVGVDYECRYCEYTEGVLEYNKRSKK